jgi:hypothetical protein
MLDFPSYTLIPTYTFNKFDRIVRPTRLFQPTRLFGTLEYTHMKFNKPHVLPCMVTKVESSTYVSQTYILTSGQFQYNEHLYGLKCQVSSCSWNILLQDRRQKVFLVS